MGEPCTLCVCQFLMRNHVLDVTGRIPRVLNDFETKPLLSDLSNEFGGSREKTKRIKAYQAVWARLQHDEPGEWYDDLDERFERELLDWLIFHKSMLIGEVIPQTYEYLLNNPAAEEREMFDHILVDEYQDLNKSEQSIIDLLAENSDLCVVGDDDQSVYSFKHAHPEGIRELLR